MATVTLTGRVKSTHRGGFKLVETITPFKGDPFDRYWTVWTNDIAHEGEQVKVSGDVSAKISRQQDGTVYLNQKGEPRVDLAVNNSTVTSDSPF